MAALKKSGAYRQLLESMYSMIALLFILVACIELCNAAAAVDVYRLIQYDMSGSPFGSRFAALNHHAASLHFPPGADLSRTVLIIPLRELNITFVREYINQKKPLGGLLFLLPQVFSFENGGNKQIHEKEKLKNVLAELEQLLIHANIPYPVYFAFENDEIDTVLSDIKKNDAIGQPATATTGGYKLVIPTPEPKKVASPTITNIQGWLSGLKGDVDANQLPTIAVVASYDTFGAAPALSLGSDSNGSGIVALLEVARLFSLLYSNPRTRGRYNLLFGLTSGGPYNYNGTQKWLRSFDQRLRESIDYAICLNSIGSWDNELWIHVSKPPENAYIKQIFEGFSNVAEELDLKVGLKHKKINISNPRRHIYGHQGKNVQIFADDSSLAVNPSYVQSWLDLLSRTPRVAPFISKNDPFVMALKKELADHTDEVTVQNEILEGIFTFYDSTHTRLNIYQVASVTFDLLLLLVLGSYLIVLFSFLVITTRGLDDLISLFRRPPSRKVKTA
ncbi:nicalin-like isoform X3 [Durio zibethinus]|uniref:Nicalin-like isoform X3 n=1 Tax=Durio zibethinus TaxID=66656 RepID=A0A6P5XL74_DURZI|nr:nicalin-like isoform X3 [Durio zibethinus]